MSCVQIIACLCLSGTLKALYVEANDVFGTEIFEELYDETELKKRVYLVTLKAENNEEYCYTYTYKY